MPCAFCEAGQRHPQFVLLLIDKRCVDSTGVLQRHAVPVWDYTRQPHARVQQHNRLGRFKHGPKKTKSGAPNYVLLMGFGPFTVCAYTFYKAMDSKATSRSTIQEQILCACALAVAWHEEVDTGHPRLQTFVEDTYQPLVRHMLDSRPTALSTQVDRVLSYAKNAMRLLRRRHARKVDSK